MRFSEDRFSFTKLYQLGNDKEIKSTNIVDFALNLDKAKLYFESEKIPKPKYSEKVVGEDMKKRLLESEDTCIVFLRHPVKEWNRNYGDIFERYAKSA